MVYTVAQIILRERLSLSSFSKTDPVHQSKKTGKHLNVEILHEN